MPIDKDKARETLNTFHQEKIGRENFVNLDTRFTGSVQNLPRYQSFGDVLGTTGFNTIQNLDKIYNDKTSSWTDVSRAYKGMLELAAIGFDDTFAMGSFKDDNNATQFMDIMTQYSSSREGFMGGFSNTLLSSGYTVGIVLGIASEQALLSGITALTGGFGGVAQAGRLTQSASRLVKSADLASDSYINFFKYARSKGTIDLAKSTRWSSNWFKARAWKMGGGVGEMFKGALPLSNTANYFRAATSGQPLNQITRGSLLAGALYQDGRKFYLAHSESKLESDMLKNETTEQLMSEWYSNNPGQIMPEHVFEKIQKDVQQGANNVYWSNFLTIYASNALLFDHMLKPLSTMQRTASKQFVKETPLFNVTREGGRLAIAAKKTPWQLYKESWNLVKQAKNLTTGKVVAGSLDWAASSSMEGFQEVAQDIISSAGKKYTASLNNSGTGSYFEALYDSLGDWDAHSFWSGFFIGAFASPVNLAVGTFNEAAFGAGSSNWTAQKAGMEKKDYQKRVEIAEMLTDFYNQTGTFSNELANNFLGPNMMSREALMEGLKSEDAKTVKDAQSRIFRTSIEKMLELNLETELTDWLSEMSSYTVEELNGALNRTDITEDNKAEVLRDITDYSNRIKEYRKIYNEMQNETRLNNPVDVSELSNEARTADPKAFLNNYMTYTAWEAMRSNYLFNREAVKDLENRIARMRMSIKTNLINMTNSDLDVLMDSDLGYEQLQILKSAVKSNEEYSSTDIDYTTQKEHQKTKQKLEILEKYQKAKDKLFNKDTDLTDDESKRLVTEMEEAFNDYVNLIENFDNSVGRKDINNQKFVYLLDVLSASSEKEAAQEHALNLLNSSYRENFLEQTKRELQYLEDNKKEIITNSVKALHEKFAGNQIVKELLEEGLIFHLSEMDDLIQKGVMPSKIFNATTNEEATKAEYDVAKEIISRAYDNLTGKKITMSNTPAMASKKFANDKRTSKDLLNETSGVKDITTLINHLLKGKQVTKAEQALLNTIMDVMSFEQNIKVIIADNLDQAVAINLDEDGNKVLMIDVRYASSDYTVEKSAKQKKASTYRFESMVLSGLLNFHLQNTMETNPAFNDMVMDLYDSAKKDMLDFLQETQPEENWTMEKIDNIAMFTDPVVFLSEALHNQVMKDALKQVPAEASAVDESIMEVLQEEIDTVLAESITDATLLAKANALALFSFADLSGVQQTATTKTEPVENIVFPSGNSPADYGLTQEDWDSLSEEEKEDIKNCR